MHIVTELIFFRLISYLFRHLIRTKYEESVVLVKLVIPFVLDRNFVISVNNQEYVDKEQVEQKLLTSTLLEHMSSPLFF